MKRDYLAISLGVLAAIVACFILVKIARAAGPSATLTWEHPTTYTDGTALALADIKETLITWRRPDSATVVGSVRVAAPTTTTVVNGLACGNFSFTAVTVVKTNDQSAETNPVLYATGVRCLPNPPTGLGAS